MAGSRLEKIGTIFTRASGLIKSKALKWEDRPLWYDVYAAFPPKDEPRYDRQAPNIALKQIFYQDDRIRAIFHRNNKQIGTVNLLGKSDTVTQRFIETYKKVRDQYKNGEGEEQIYKEAIDILNRERQAFKEAAKQHETEEDAVSLSVAFKEAQKNQEKTGIQVRDLFRN